jgi:integrase
MSDYLIQRGVFWHFFRWVPAEYADIDRRKIVSKSTKIRVADDPDRRRARQIADKINTSLEAYWRDLAAGQAAGARQRFREATTRARRMGFDYVTTAELAAGPVAELLRRIEALESRGMIPAVPTPESMLATDAVLGGAQEGRVMVSGLFEEYRTHKKAEIHKFARERLRIWTNAHKAAADNFLLVLGADKPLDKLVRRDATAFQQWWSDRIVDEGLKASSANIQIGHVAAMLETVAGAQDIDLAPLFAKLKIKDDPEKRPAFALEHIRDRMLAPDALANLNVEARNMLYVMIETGMRPAEIVGVEPKSIKLDANVPHIELIPNAHRGLKTKKSRRLVPLVGVALEAMRAQRNGFPRYAGKAPSLSATVNQHLYAAGLLPTEHHTLYSLRHSFKDRMRAVEAPLELIKEIMGHANGGPDYGDGYSLEQKAKWLQRIALPVPSRL